MYYDVLIFSDKSWDHDGQEVLKQIPKKGSLVLEDVLHSTYFFS